MSNERRNVVSAFIQKSFEKQLATKLIDGFEKLQENFEESRKRWVWELIQNACDVSEGNLNLEIHISDNTLSFWHNGKPFTDEQLIYLIQQTSTKERNDKMTAETIPSAGKDSMDTIGKYGTGFLTTHLLSRKILLQSVKLDSLNNTYIPFKLVLDRTPDDLEGMIKKVNETFERFNELDNSKIAKPIKDYKPGVNLDTGFIFDLQTPESKETVAIGLAGFEKVIPYVFAFNRKISSIVIKRKDQMNIYKRASTSDLGDGITYVDTQLVEEGKIRIICKSNGMVTIAFALSEGPGDTWTFINKDQKMPTIFVDLPLIGSESLEFPIVINSRFFEPNEQRSSISLSHGKHYPLNRKLLEQAFDLYQAIFPTLVDFPNRHLVTHFPILPCYDFKKWLIPEVRRIRQTLFNLPIVSTEKGKLIRLKDARIPFFKDTATTLELCKILNPIIGESCPAINLESFTFWHAFLDQEWIMSFNFRFLEVGELLGSLASFQNITKLDKITGGYQESITMLNKVYAIVKDCPEFALHLIVPNQRGDFCLVTKLKKDLGIEDKLKTVASNLQNTCRVVLMDRSIKLALQDSMSELEVIDIINNALTINHQNLIFYITAFMPKEPELLKHRKRIFSIVKAMKLNIANEIEIHSSNSNIWLKSDKLLASLLLKKIEDEKNIQTMEKSIENPKAIIKEVVSLFFSEAISRTVFPNQMGVFCQYTQLKVSSVENELTQSHSPSQQKIASMLFQLVELTGHKLKDELIDAECIQSNLRLASFSLSDAILHIQNYLRDRNNYSGENFHTIFKVLSLLDIEYSFKKVQEFQDRKEEMFYSIASPEEKALVIELLTDRNSQKKIGMIKDISCEEITDALELKRIIESNSTDANEATKKHLLAKRLIGSTHKYAEEEIEILTDLFKEPDLARKFIQKLKKVKHDVKERKEKVQHDVKEPKEEFIPKIKRENIPIIETQNQINYLPCLPAVSHQPALNSSIVKESSRTVFTFKEKVINTPQEDQTEEPEPNPHNTQEKQPSCYFKKTGRKNSDITQEKEDGRRKRYTPIMIKNSVRSIYRHLKSMKDKYNVKNAKVRSPNDPKIIDGVEYLGREISVIAQPGHHGFIRISSKEQLEALESHDNQLWIDRGEGEPMQMTLGGLIKCKKLIRKRIHLR